MASSFGSFGGNPPAPAPAANFSFSAPPAAAGSAPPVPAATTQASMTVPEYESLFSGQSLWTQTKSLATAALNGEDPIAGQELVHHVVKTCRDKLLNPSTLKLTAPNMPLRQRLLQNPTVMYKGTEAVLTMPMLQQVVALADDLRISEEAAMCLYAKASPEAARREILEALDPQTMRHVTIITMGRDQAAEGDQIGQVARALYFLELKLALRALLLLLQNRLSDSFGYIIQATDDLLQSGIIYNLIGLVREYTRLVDGMQQELARLSPGAPTTFLSTLVHFCAGERLAAAQALFFIAYQSQLEGQEVAALADLVRDLSNNLPILDPFDDQTVPSPYHSSTDFSAAMTNPYVGSSTDRQKDPLEWKKELVQRVWQTGKPELLRCVSVCVVAVLAALDTHNELMDRTTHAINQFGKGNALLRPELVDNTRELLPFHEKLSRRAKDDWKRHDILGALMAGYSRLLHESPVALTSPRMGPETWHGGAGSIDIQKGWKECLLSPMQLKSITFAHNSLIPALHIPTDALLPDCTVSEFLLSTLAKFTSHYFDLLLCDNDAPVSRQKWEQDATESLRLNTKHQEEHRSFQSWAGTSSVDYDQLPTSVDLLDRPDCMDDVVAYATAVCSLGPTYASFFWTRKEGPTTDVESRPSPYFNASAALRVLGQHQAGDDTLRPGYLSFLAALALAEVADIPENGASFVYRLLSDKLHSTESWASLFDVLRYFVSELDPQATRGTPTDTSASSATASHYYDDSGLSGPKAGPFDRIQGGASRLSDVTQTKELGESNSCLVLSVLMLISNVAFNSASARLSLLCMPIRIEGAGARGNEVIGRYTALMILFSFARQPLSPEVRGAAFSTIASLLRNDSMTDVEKTKLRDCGLTAWEMLEAGHFISTSLSDESDSPRIPPPQNGEALQGIAFPPSSTSMAMERNAKSLIARNKIYSIVDEMECVEACVGVYPSTEGFLRLLHSLFESVGSPSHIGRDYRRRTGCTPYVEYVVKLILRRTISRDDPLPFDSLLSRRRLITLALKVADVVLTQYLVVPPRDAQTTRQIAVARAYAQLLLQCESIQVSSSMHALVSEPRLEDADLFCQDFDLRASDAQATDSSNVGSHAMHRGIAVSTVPQTVSPGLFILVEILSPLGGDLLRAIIAAIVDTETLADREQVDERSLAFATFNATPPTFTSVKSGVKGCFGMLLKKLRTSVEADTIDSVIYWREQQILTALHLCCAAAVREKMLSQIINSLPRSIKLVSSISSQGIGRKRTLPDTVDLEVSGLSQLLKRSNERTGIVCHIIDLIGCSSHNDEDDVEIALAAAVLVSYVIYPWSQGSLHGDTRLEGDVLPLILDRAFGRRLVKSCRRSSTSLADRDLVALILEPLVTAFRKPGTDSNLLVNVLLDIPVLGRTEVGSSGCSGITLAACFNAILQVLRDDLFVFSPETSNLAATCYEVVFRMYEFAINSGDGNLLLRVSQRLHTAELWRLHLHNLTQGFFHRAESRKDNHLLHSVAWLLQSMALEMRVVNGTHGRTMSSVQLLSSLFEPPADILCTIIHHTPVEKPLVTPSSLVLPDELVRAAKVQLSGAPEVVQGYEIVDRRGFEGYISGWQSSDQEALRIWSDEWNEFIRRDCATAHLSKAIQSVLATVNVVFGSPGTTMPCVEANCGRVLYEILDRITSETMEKSGILDQACYTTATRNLAHAALEASAAVERADGVSETINYSLGVRAIMVSHTPQHWNGTGDSRARERTVLLAMAVCQLLGENLNGQRSFLDEIDWIHAGRVLAHLACTSFSSGSHPHARVACACLVHLLDVATNQDSSNVLSSVLSFDQNEPRCRLHPIQQLLDGLEHLDPGATNLLQKILLLPVGTQVLHHFNVIDAVEVAARRYAKFSDEPKSGHTDITTLHKPDVVTGHLYLLMAAMSAEAGDHLRLHAIATGALDVLQLYIPALEKVMSIFPLEGGEILHASFHCMGKAKMILRSSVALKSTHVIDNPPSASLLSRFEKQSLSLLLHMAEYPLPCNLLPPLPPLQPNANLNGIDSRAFVNGKTWWDRLITGTASMDEILSYAGLGAEILSTGLSVFSGGDWPLLSDAEQLARAICRCVESIRVIEKQISSMVPAVESHGYCEDEAASAWPRAYLADAVALLVGACLRLMQKIEQVEPGMAQSEMVPKVLKTLHLTLDMSRLDTEGIQPIHLSHGDENHDRAASLKDLACTLREAIRNII